MLRHKGIYAALLAAVFVGLAGPAIGQIISGQPTEIEVRPIYLHWKIDDTGKVTKINQFVIPISGTIPLKDGLEARFFIGSTNNTLTGATGSDMSLSGLSDARIQFNKTTADDHLLLSLGFNLPTGKKKLNLTEELPVTVALSQNYLTFPVRRLGEGFDVNALVGVATASGRSRFGGSLMYQINGSYTAFENAGDYKPGNQFSLTAGYDTRSDKTLFGFSVIYSLLGTDKLADNDIFKMGNQLDIGAHLAFTSEQQTLAFDGRYLVRGRTTTYNSDATIYEQLKVYGNEFAACGSLAWKVSPDWQIVPAVELRLIAANEQNFGNSNIFGFGGDIVRKMGSNVDCGIGAKYYTGSADSGGINLSGYQMSLGLTVRL